MIEAQRQELARLFESGTLRNHAEKVLPKCYLDGVHLAVAETDLAATTFPSECPYSIEQLESPDLLAE